MMIPVRVGVVALLATSLSAQSTTTPHDLLDAIRHGDTTTVGRAIGSGIDPNTTDTDGIPALMLATLFGDEAGVELLLKRGADPNRPDAAGATALMWAIPDIERSGS